MFMNQGTNGAGGAGYASGLLRTPHPAFDLSSQYMPTEVRQLYRWCLWVYYNNPVVKAVLDKMTAYVLQDKIFLGEERARKTYDTLFNSVIGIKDLEAEVMANMVVYGNAFVGILYPRMRYLVCNCGKSSPLYSLKWRYANHEWIADCPACKSKNSKMRSVTKFLPGAWSKVSVINWNPQDIYPFKNPWTGEKEIWYKPPEKYQKIITDTRINKVFVASTPDPILRAIKEKKYVKLDPKNVFQFKTPGPSTHDNSLSMPVLFHIFKETWIYMVYRRADEAIASEHVLPFTLVTPRPESGGTSLHLTAGLRGWSSAVGKMFRIWRRDQNTIGTLPFPADVSNIRGDAKALDVTDKMRDIKQSISALMGMPMDMLTGDMRYSGSSISLRMLENQYQTIINGFTKFGREFLLPRLKAWFNLPEIEMQTAKFKMADDAAQREMMIRLRQSNDISRKTALTELGQDYDKEREQLKVEREENSKVLRESMEDQARTQGIQTVETAKSEGEAMLIKSEAQAKGQILMNELMSRGNAEIKDYKEVINKNVPTFLFDEKTKESQGDQSNDVLKAKADWIKYNVSEDQRAGYVERLTKSNPALGAYVKQQLMADKSSADAVRKAYDAPANLNPGKI